MANQNTSPIIAGSTSYADALQRCSDVTGAKCCSESDNTAADPLFVEVVNSCDNPVNTQECDPALIGIENTSWCAIRDDGVEGHIEIIRDEDGAFNSYVFHAFGGTATPVADLSTFSRCGEKQIIQNVAESTGFGDDRDCLPVHACCNFVTDETTYFYFPNGVKTEIMGANLGNINSAVSTRCEIVSSCTPVLVSVGADTPLDYATILAAVQADITADGAAWSNGDAITLDATDQGCVSQLELTVAQCEQEGVDIADGTTAAVVSNDANSVQFSGTTYSAGGSASVGGSPKEDGTPVAQNETGNLEDGAGVAVKYTLSRCFNAKSGELIVKN